ncbi:hypothetical protein PCANC_09382 [Puccinia coronata f. sp. avenae]|uniref:Reverse transcriptase Ty1/copia-type domain-containing protein n=1 Tax=Puccinia coronata f. sp. avenae TaxID=200324 RepID=A0A2N5VDA8_9BASI|nr:hypothetical protein PCANC_09382 [Puccinia coronata f. sp. avenae]
MEDKNLVPTLDTSIPDEMKHQIIAPNLPLSTVKLGEDVTKHDLSYIVNCFRLRDFLDEITIEHQELLVDVLLSRPTNHSVPRTAKQALKGKDGANWLAAIKEELRNLQELGVWEVELVPDNTRILGAQWVFAKKFNSKGEIQRYKARHVAKGYSQIKGKHFDKTFAPTATFISMRLILTIVACFNWPVHSFDFVAAYLNSPIDEEVWVTAPKGLDVLPGHACQLKKALYGTKQAGRCWWQHLSGLLQAAVYQLLQYDTLIYCLKEKRTPAVIWVHVDDGIVTGLDEATIKRLKETLKSSIKIKWSEGLESIVGLSINRSPDGFCLTRLGLVNKILEEQWDGMALARAPFPTEALPETNKVK